MATLLIKVIYYRQNQTKSIITKQDWQKYCSKRYISASCIHFVYRTSQNYVWSFTSVSTIARTYLFHHCCMELIDPWYTCLWQTAWQKSIATCIYIHTPNQRDRQGRTAIHKYKWGKTKKGVATVTEFTTKITTIYPKRKKKITQCCWRSKSKSALINLGVSGIFAMSQCRTDKRKTNG